MKPCSSPGACSKKTVCHKPVACRALGLQLYKCRVFLQDCPVRCRHRTLHSGSPGGHFIFISSDRHALTQIVTAPPFAVIRYFFSPAPRIAPHPPAGSYRSPELSSDSRKSDRIPLYHREQGGPRTSSDGRYLQFPFCVSPKYISCSLSLTTNLMCPLITPLSYACFISLHKQVQYR